MSHRSQGWAVFVFVAVVAGVAFWGHAGDLRPPAGPVAPTMKTLDQLSAQIAALQAPVKQVVRGVIPFPKDQREASQTLSSAVNPAKSVVMLSDAVATAPPVSSDPNWGTRTGACVTSLTGSQITIRVDASVLLAPAEVSYQVIEYN